MPLLVRWLGRRNSAVKETIITAGDRRKNIFPGKPDDVIVATINHNHPPMKPFSEPVTALMLRLVIATIIAATLGLCSLEQAIHSTKKAGELIGIIGGGKHPVGARNDSGGPEPRP